LGRNKAARGCRRLSGDAGGKQRGRGCRRQEQRARVAAQHVVAALYPIQRQAARVVCGRAHAQSYASQMTARSPAFNNNKAASKWIRAAARSALVRTRACAQPQRWAPACLAGCAAMELQPVPPGPRPLLTPSFRLGLGLEAEVPSLEELLLATPGLACPSGRAPARLALAQALLLPCRTVYCRRSGPPWQGRAKARLSKPHYVSASQPVAQECRLWAWQGRGCV